MLAKKPALDLSTLVAQRFEQSMAVPEAFFSVEAERIARACWAMARRFHQGGRLLALGNGAWATDAQHVAVEFVHPVIVGKRALPALALTNDSATLSSAARPFERQIKTLARPQDIALGFSLDGCCENVAAALSTAKQMGLLTLGLAGCEGELFVRSGFDFCFVVPARDPFVIQETHETLYHVLWELVHIFFEHEGLLTAEVSDAASCALDTQGRCITCSDEALPARVIRVDQQRGFALVKLQETREAEVDITLVDEIAPGDWLLVHGGVAIERLERQKVDEASNE